MFSLEGKNAFVIGATAGLGLAVAKSYAESGAQVAIGGRRDGDAIADSIGAQFVRIDVADEQSVSDALAAAEALLGKLDILVNNAGIYPAGMLKDIAADDQQRNLDVNINGVLWGLKHGPKHMNDGGAIINTSSLLARSCMAGVGAYAAAKAAVTSLTKTAALELAPRGIRVNAVSPTTVLGTEQNEDLAAEELAVVNMLTPLGRASETSDYLGIYTLLATDAGRFINAQDIAVDGELTAGVSLQNIEKLFS